MFIQLANLFHKHHDEWGYRLFGEVVERENPFAFDNASLWDKAQVFLQRYIEREIESVVEGKRMVVFTNRDDLLFTRINENTEQVLEMLVSYLQDECQEEVTVIDRAFLECKLYNEVEELIITGAIQKVFIKSYHVGSIQYFLFARKMKMLLEAGKEVVFTELEELYAAYHYKTVWQYHYKG
ncbi:MAG: hypothetical protein ACRCWY_10730 [Cellulosilyticaceae bacterium]